MADTIVDAFNRDIKRRVTVEKRERALRNAKTPDEIRWAKLGVELIRLDGWLGGYQVREMMHLHNNRLVSADDLETRLGEHKIIMKRKLAHAKTNAPEIHQLYTDPYYNDYLQ